MLHVSVSQVCLAQQPAQQDTGPARAGPGPSDAVGSTGKKLSLDVQSADLKDVLRLIADVGDLNIVLGPEVEGRVTTRLIDVPWDQALDALLKLHGLTLQRHGNVILISRLERFMSQQQQETRRREVEASDEPIVTRVIPVKYTAAERLKANLEKFLGDCASISVNAHTNQLVITGTPSCLRMR